MSSNISFRYTRVNRAAELLNCNPCDILHYASLGFIELCLFVDNLRGYLIVNDKHDIDYCENWFREKWVSKFNATVAVTKSSLFRFDFQWEKDDYAVDYLNKISKTAFKVYKEERYWHPSREKTVKYSSVTTGYGVMMGLWAVCPNACLEIEKFCEYKLTNLDLHPANTDEDCIVQQAVCEQYCINNCDDICVCANTSFNYTITLDDLWITFEEFEKIKRINIQEICDITLSFNKDNDNEITDNRGNHWAEKRGEIKLAATHLKKEKPELCGDTIEKWVDALFDMAHVYWPSSGEPPLKRKTVTGIISRLKKESS
ncbi:hypothetical protein M4879_004602 [Salmonella enterica]|nr:hypothetical protein [Salmonella enterica]EJE5418893.1 hypothetical protein [Salmonella enterica]EKF2440928.1 hypothetical protein [Salmonella enterica]EKF2443933.1 hypothetical protein [Salmonella enterica]